MNARRPVAGIALALGLLVAVVSALTTETAHAQRSEGWFAVLGSFESRRGAHRRAESRCLAYSGHDVYVLNSDDVEGFTPGLWVVVAGPHRSRSRADRIARELRRCVPDAYVRYGEAYD
jgi:cell division septation protein DedD